MFNFKEYIREMKNIAFIIVLFIYLASCTKTDKQLPIIGKTTVINNDTIYSTIRPFSFINQDSLLITDKTFENKIYIADFFFLTCPTICPKMTNELLKVYDVFKSNPHVYFLSHTIDPEHDTVSKLKEHAKDLGIDSKKWFFVTGNQDSIYALANESYFAAAFADKDAPGGYIHSGSLLLVDINKHIRGVYNGTIPADTDRLIKDLKSLLAEQFKGTN